MVNEQQAFLSLGRGLFSGDLDIIDETVAQFERLNVHDQCALLSAIMISPQKYSDGQNEGNGLWQLSWLMGDLFRKSDIGLECARLLLSSAKVLFDTYFNRFTIDDGGTIYGFWDSICNPWWLAGSLKKYSDILLDLLEHILITSDSILCKKSALHGLNHINENRKMEIINKYLMHETHSEIIELAQKAAKGDLQ